jgi:hypothetical protein
MLTVWLAATGSARAGLYNTEEPQILFGQSGDFSKVFDALQSIVAVETESRDDSPRNQVLRRVKELEQKLKDSTLDLQERINLSAYYIRLHKPENFEKAVALLEKVPRSQRNFMVLSNLATASQLAGRLERAEAYLTEALTIWPMVSVVFSGRQLNWLRMAEKYHLNLVRQRQLEARQPRGGSPGVDAIFPKVKFVGPSGQYEAGILAADQWVNMPADALDVVKQLILWLPHEPRLRWLMAELVNATGNFSMALKIMDDLATQSFNNLEFAAHRRILRQAQQVAEIVLGNRDAFVKEQTSWSLAPMRDLLPPGVSPTLGAAGLAMALENVSPNPRGQVDLEPSAVTETPRSSPSSSGWSPEWRQIAVSFVAGAVVATLLSLQFRELRRRRQQQDAEAASRG